MKIKRTIEMNLHELIKWAWENDVRESCFTSELDKCVCFGLKGTFSTENMRIKSNEIFKVEIEEEITEDTVLNLIVVNRWGKAYDIVTAKKTSISGIKHSSTKYFYLQNDDGSIGHLIWKDGELIE